MENNNKYQNGKIYRITDIGYNKFYYGSTIEQLSKRMAKHRCKYKGYKEGKEHFFSIFTLFDEYGINGCKIELVEHFPCNDKPDLLKREGWYIENNNCVNKHVAGRTDDECKRNYRLCNPDKIKETRVRYNEKHGDKRKCNINCPVCGCSFQKMEKARHERTIKHLQNLEKSSSSEQSNN
jgi:hypothetical protein